MCKGIERSSGGLRCSSLLKKRIKKKTGRPLSQKICTCPLQAPWRRLSTVQILLSILSFHIGFSSCSSSSFVTTPPCLALVPLGSFRLALILSGLHATSTPRGGNSGMWQFSVSSKHLSVDATGIYGQVRIPREPQGYRPILTFLAGHRGDRGVYSQGSCESSIAVYGRLHS